MHLELLQAQEQQLAALEASLVRDFDAALQRLRGERARVVVRVVMAAASRRLVLRAELAVLESTAVRDADLARQLKRVDEEQRAAEAEACVHEKAAADAAARLAALAERCAALSAAAEELIACGGGSDAARSAALMAVYGGTAESGSGEASSVPADAATQRRLLALRQHRLDGDERAAEESAALHALQAVHAKALARAQAAAALASQLRGQAAAWRSETQARLNAITLELPLTAKQIAAGPAQQQLLELLQLPGPLPPAPAAVATAAAPTATAPVLLFPRARLAALRARAGEIDAEVATLLVMRADLSAELEVCKHESRQLQAEARGAAAKAAALSRLKFGRELDIAKLDRATAAQRTVVEAEAQSSATAAAISVAAGSGGAVAGSRDEEAEEAQVAADSAASAAALRRAVQCRTMAVNDAVAQRARKLRAHAALRARESRGGPTASIADALASLAGAVACEAGAISSAGEPVQQRRTAGGSAAATRHAISVLRAASRAAPSRALAAAATASSGDEGSAAGDDDDDLLAFVEAQSEELVALSREASLLRRRQHLPPPPPSPRYIRIATASLGSASAMVDEAPAVVPAATHRIAGLALQPSAPPAQPSQLQLRGHGARRDVSMVKEARAAGVEAAAAGAHAPPPPPLPHQPASLLAVGAWPPPVAGSGSATRPTSARRGSTQPLGAGLARLRPASVGVPPQPPPQLAVIGSGAPSPRRRSVDYKQ